MLKTLKWLALLLLTGLLLVVGTASWLLMTPSGMQQGMTLLQRLLPELTIESAEGRFYDALQLSGIRYQPESGPAVHIEQLALQWSLPALQQRQLVIETLVLDGVTVIDSDTTESTDAAGELPVIVLPIDIAINSLTVNDMQFIDSSGHSEQWLEQLSLGLAVQQQTLLLHRLELQRTDLQLSSQGIIAINPPYDLSLDLDLLLQLPELDEIALSGSISGNLEQLIIRQTLSQPLHADIELVLDDLLEELGWQLNLQADQWALADVIEDQTLLLQAIELQAQGDLNSVSGSFNSRLIETGLPPLQLTASFSSADFDNWQLDSQLDIAGRSQLLISGQAIEVSSEQPQLAFTGQWHNLVWPYDQQTLLLQDSSGEFSVTGSLQALKIQLTAMAQLRGDELIPDQQLAIVADALLTEGYAEIAGLSVQSADGSLLAQGRIDWQETLLLDLDVDWRDLTIPEGILPVSVSSNQGHIRLHGTEQAFQLVSNASLSVDQQPLSLNLTGRGDISGFEQLQLQVLVDNAGAVFAGNVDWQDKLGVAGELQLENFNPALLAADWPGQLSGRGQIDLLLEDEALELRVEQLLIEGLLRQLPVRLSADLQYQDQQLQVPALEFRSGDSWLQLSGQMQEQLNFDWQLESPDLANFYPDLGGQLAARGRIRGRLEAPDISAQLDGQQLAWQQRYQLGGITATLSAQEAGQGQLQLNGELTDIQIEQQQIDQLAIALSGSLLRHQLALQLSAQDMQLATEFAGGWQDERWQGQINKFDFDSEISGLWQLSESGPVLLSAARSEFSQHCWRSSELGVLCLQGQTDAELDWQAQGHFAELPIALLNPFIDEFAELAGQLAGEFELRAGEDALPIGQLQIQLQQGKLQLSELVLDQEKPILLETVRLQVALDAAQSQAHFELLPDIDGVSAIEAELVSASLSEILASPDTAQLTGQLQASLADLAVLQLSGPAYDNLSGGLTMSATIGGTVSEAQLAADMQLTDAAVDLLDMGIRLTGIYSSVAGDLREGINFNYRAQSGDGQIEGEGRLQFADDSWQLNANLQGQQFELMNVPEAYVIAEPNLRFAVDPTLLNITGEVSIPTAELAPLQFNTSISASDDVVVLGRQQPETEATAMRTQVDVNVILGDAVRITAMGFNGRLTGQLRVSGDASELLMGNGEIILTDGSYDAYGQQLRVNDGRIRFSGAAIDNPDLDVRAVRTGTGFTAGIHIQGPADNPQATLFSTPSMSQDNILSHILLGRPLMQANDSDAAFLASAATSLGIRNGAMIGEQIASSFGLDSFALSGDTPETAAVEIGKYLSPRLYVSYGIGVFEPVSTMQLRYTLSRLFTLRAESGLETGVDLLYTYERR